MASKKAATSSKAKTTKAAATKKATRSAHAATKASKAKGATKKATGAKKADTGGTSRKDAVVALISRPKGATLAELMTATGWQAHSIRGFMCTLGKSMKIGSAKVDGARTYTAA
jgi:hypothetical protein